MELAEELVPVVVFNLGPLQVTSTVVYTWIIMAVVAVVFAILGRNLQIRPSRVQNALEWLVEVIDTMIRDMIHEQRFILLPESEEIDLAHHEIRIGVYNRVTGERLPARTSQGEALPDDILPLSIQTYLHGSTAK